MNHMCQYSEYRWLTHEAFEITYWPTFLIHFDCSISITISLNIASKGQLTTS